MKYRKLFTALLVVLLAFSGVTSVAMAATEVEGSAYVGYSSKYLWRGFDLSNGNPVVQGGVDVGFNGLTFSYWSNLDLDTGEISETDFTIDYGFALSDLVAVGVGNVFYSLENAADTNELYLGVSLDTLLAPTLTLYYDYDEAQKDGLFYTFSIAHELELAETLTLGLGGLVSYNQQSDYSIGDYTGWHNYEFSATLDYALNGQVGISPYLIYSDAISAEAERVIADEFVGGITFSFNF